MPVRRKALQGGAHPVSRSVAIVVSLLLVPSGLAAQDVAELVGVPPENPISEEKALLGKFLFWEEQVGGDNTMACGTCHIPELGGADPRSLDPDSVNPGADGVFGTPDDERGSKGVVSFDQPSNQFAWEDTFFPGHQVTGRKAPTALNAGLFVTDALSVGLFWDGRASATFVDPQTGETAIDGMGSLESQAVEPPLSSVEMAGQGQSWEGILGELATATPLALASGLPPDMQEHHLRYPTYPEMFNAAFGSPELTSKRFAFAIATYERTLLSDQTPLDLQFQGVQQMAPELQPGLSIFMNACHVCHLAPITMDWSFHNIGVQPDEADPGLGAVTGDPADLGKFKTPQLRNVALRPPFFHDGSRTTLEEVVEFYDQGGGFDTNGLKDPALLPLGLTDQEKANLVLFLEEALTDPRVAAGEPPFDRPTLGSEARAANVVFGTGTPGGGGVVPGVLAHVPANLGHDDFMVGLHDAPPGRAALLLFSSGMAPDTVVGGITVNIAPDEILLVMARVTDAQGVATADLALPANPALAGFVVYANWVVVDPDAAAGLSSTRGIELNVL